MADTSDVLSPQELLALKQPSLPDVLSPTEMLEYKAVGDPVIAENLGKSLAKGTGSLLGFLGQVSPFGPGPMQLGDRIKREITGAEVKPPLFMEQVEDIRRAVVPDPQYKTATGRIIGAGVEALPTAVIPGGGLFTRLGTALTGGMGGQVAEEAGQSPLIGSLLGSGVFSLARGGTSSLFKPLTKAGKKEIAGGVLRKAAGKEGTRKVLEQADDVGGPFGKKTFAEVAKTPGAANLQKKIGQEVGDEGGNLIMRDLELRAAARNQSLDDLADDVLKGATPAERGDRLRGLLLEAQDDADDAVKAAWDNVKLTNISFDVQGAADEIIAAARETGEVIPLSGNAQRVIKAIDEAGGSLSAKQYQAIRSAAGRQFAIAARGGDNQEARIMAIVRSRLDDAALKAADSGKIDAKNLESLHGAIAETRAFKQKYETGVIEKILKQRDGEFRAGAARAIKETTRTKEAAEELVAKFGDSEEVIKQGRGALLDELESKATGRAKLRVLTKKKDQFKALFGKDYPRIEEFIKDLDSELDIDRLNQVATGSQSITGQYKTSADFIKNMSLGIKALKRSGETLGAVGGIGGTFATGNIFTGGLSAIAGTVIGNKIEALAELSEQGIKSLLVSAMMDPKKAKLLMQTPTTSTLKALGEALPIAVTVGAEQELGSSGLFTSGKKETMTEQGGGSAEGGGGSYGGLVGTGAEDALIESIIYQESRGNPKAVGPSTKYGTAKGLMQLIDSTGKAMHKEMGLSGKYDPFNEEQNREIGTYYFNKLLERFEDPKLALAGYNAGPTKVQRLRSRFGDTYEEIEKHLPKETQNYVRQVLARL